jgi:UbiD family decarboxylase
MSSKLSAPSLAGLELNALVAALEARGALLRVGREVEPRFELSAVIQAVQKGPNLPVLFERVKGSRYPVLSNVNGSYERVSSLLGGHTGNLAARWAAMMDIDPASLPQESAAAAATEEVTLAELPQVVFSGKDAGPYITAGIIAARDPQTGVQNLSYHRSQIISTNELRCRLGTTGDLFRIQQAAEARGEDLPVAMMIGVPPAVLLAGATSYGPEVQELDIAAKLAGKRLAMRRVDSAHVDVPANAHFIIEGEILAGVRRPEGPYGDWLQYYVPVADNHVLKVNRITARRDAIYYAILGASTEEITTSGVPICGGIYRAVRAWVPSVRDVCCYPSMQFCVVQIENQYEGQARKAMLAAFGAELTRVLYCVVVDEDIDIHDPVDVIWAISTRCRPDRDIFQIPDVPSAGRDAHCTYWGRLGVDATKPLAWRDEFERRIVPGADTLDLADYLRPLRKT